MKAIHQLIKTYMKTTTYCTKILLLRNSSTTHAVLRFNRLPALKRCTRASAIAATTRSRPQTDSN